MGFWLDGLFRSGVVNISNNGVVQPFELTLDFVGSGMSVTHDAEGHRNQVLIPGGDVVQRVVSGDPTLTAVPFGLVFADPGGGSGTGCAIESPIDTVDGEHFTVKDATGTADGTTKKISVHGHGSTALENPAAIGTYSTDPVFLTHAGASATWVWDANHSRWIITSLL